MTKGVFVSAYFIAASKMHICSPFVEGEAPSTARGGACAPQNFVTPPSVPGTIRILLREIAIKFAERFRPKRRLHNIADLAESRPEIAKEGFFAVLILPKWVAGKIDMNSTGEGKSDNQRRRHQKIRFDMLMHAGF